MNLLTNQNWELKSTEVQVYPAIFHTILKTLKANDLKAKFKGHIPPPYLWHACQKASKSFVQEDSTFSAAALSPEKKNKKIKCQEVLFNCSSFLLSQSVPFSGERFKSVGVSEVVTGVKPCSIGLTLYFTSAWLHVNKSICKMNAVNKDLE